MAATIVGQLGAVDVPGTATLTDIYTVPTAAPGVPNRISDVNVFITNRTDVTTNIRLAHIKGGLAAAVSDEDYIFFDLPTSALSSNLAPVEKSGILMAEGDTIAVYSSDEALSVQVNGVEGDET